MGIFSRISDALSLCVKHAANFGHFSKRRTRNLGMMSVRRMVWISVLPTFTLGIKYCKSMNDIYGFLLHAGYPVADWVGQRSGPVHNCHRQSLHPVSSGKFQTQLRSRFLNSCDCTARSKENKLLLGV
ncbi:hypothetical protein TWF569_005726 [Orbilia oligospora]|uniref:Uncharacterized protein n=1 Tax=Orbilia oligospora TaxID=2813651 RepID=A0A7C8JGI1_ORBOL|nr:hypothetical protein TWF706_011849 [Orbilia oligospora]KAF3087814.1 hypothetical protein TWF103_001314 [Orbilia oligospora]KAF3090347.1 hypothetical protein TWF102_009311 [Orbilia oligospora]KAF3125480.1 hypothetical protein TWF594_001587 [Orbilia oligospora]KAF3148382.1 hypothetical protein TWF569_005726 [Orbilia oligospora]